MSAKELLLKLKSNIETESQIKEDDTLVTSIDGSTRESRLTVEIRVEGKIRLFEVKSRLLAEYEGSTA